jgi:hypothetical protein
LDVTSVALAITEREGVGDSESRKENNSEETSEHCVDWSG